MNFVEQFLWILYPYIALTLFVVGHIYRYSSDPLGWTAQSSQLLEQKKLKWGSFLFHFGIVAVLGGHIAGLLVPKAFFDGIGISNELYHQGAIYGGGPVGLIAFAGMVLLALRRFGNDRILAVSSVSDRLIVLLLLGEILLGIGATFSNLFDASHFDYRQTIAPWFRSLFIFCPDSTLMSSVPWIFKLHILAGFFIFALWPFTRLVHVWSLPVEYLQRAYIQYWRR
ncbi:MAG: respiratory nitrate reductase subunit gamma [Sporomusaceae bacterium]|nr:respiratory nitrate reductase subunit gamma [Sporomusaceae bacterium]